jgi:hypothetical protein
MPSEGWACLLIYFGSVIAAPFVGYALVRVMVTLSTCLQTRRELRDWPRAKATSSEKLVTSPQANG